MVSGAFQGKELPRFIYLLIYLLKLFKAVPFRICDFGQCTKEKKIIKKEPLPSPPPKSKNIKKTIEVGDKII